MALSPADKYRWVAKIPSSPRSCSAVKIVLAFLRLGSWASLSRSSTGEVDRSLESALEKEKKRLVSSVRWVLLTMNLITTSTQLQQSDLLALLAMLKSSAIISAKERCTI